MLPMNSSQEHRNVLIYNIFPLLAGNTEQWPSWARHASDMGFDWIYLNPFTQSGLSGSLYAVKDFFRVDSRLLPPEHGPTGFTETQWAIHQMKAMGLRVMFDLVINHTSIDSPLVDEHPDWYVRDSRGRPQHPFAIDPADARKKTVWGDLFELDHSNPEVLEYFREVVRFYVRLGADGFRCDAAYKVPANFWQELKKSAEDEAEHEILFLAESLGCKEEELAALSGAGFDFLYDSSKWWNFDAPWLLEQQDILGPIAPTVGFPENHDTQRLAQHTGGLQQVQKQRYAFGLAFSAGFQTTMGYEWGWRKQCHVVETTPADQEEHHMNLVHFITRLNGLKHSLPELTHHGTWEPVTSYDLPHLVMRRMADGSYPFYMLINKDWHNEQRVSLGEPLQILRVFSEDRIEWQSVSGEIMLQPAEVIYGRPA